jgi:hypothetical protein
LNEIREHLNHKYDKIIADSGCENEEDYVYLEKNGQIAFIKPAKPENTKRTSAEKKTWSTIVRVIITSARKEES